MRPDPSNAAKEILENKCLRIKEGREANEFPWFEFDSSGVRIAVRRLFEAEQSRQLSPSHVLVRDRGRHDLHVDLELPQIPHLFEGSQEFSVDGGGREAEGVGERRRRNLVHGHGLYLDSFDRHLRERLHVDIVKAMCVDDSFAEVADVRSAAGTGEVSVRKPSVEAGGDACGGFRGRVGAIRITRMTRMTRMTLRVGKIRRIQSIRSIRSIRATRVRMAMHVKVVVARKIDDEIVVRELLVT